MYNSPIDICTTIPDVIKEIDRKTGEEIYKAVVNVGISVDKDELIRALKYDRDQYNKGLKDGYEARDSEIVRCKDCKKWNCYGGEDSHKGDCSELVGLESCMYEDDFCSYGERKVND